MINRLFGKGQPFFYFCTFIRWGTFCGLACR